jgi:hypothetical protein
MTQTRLDVKLGGSKVDVTVNTGSSIGTSAVRIMYDTANITSKADLIKAMDAVYAYLISAKWPVA